MYIDAGSRFENEELRGVTHIVDRLAFKVRMASWRPRMSLTSEFQSTKARTSEQMYEALETLGGNIHCASSRESLMYQSASFNSSVPTTVGLLAETIRSPLITEQEVQQQLETAEYEIREIWSKPELILPELVNVAAYKNNTLGNPLLCPQERLPFINKSVVEKYRNTFFHPERMVVAFAGVSHEEALKLTEQHFGDMERSSNIALSRPGLGTSSPNSPNEIRYASSPTSSSSTLPAHATSGTGSSQSSPQTPRFLSSVPFLKNLSTFASSKASVSPLDPGPQAPFIDLGAPAHYTGGFLSLPPLPPPQNPALPHLSHIHLAFESLPISSPDIYALATLQTLLGGGGSFSAGGPGKGMYSRLYTNVLNHHGWVESCVAFNQSYTDSGFFGISGSCSPARVADMLEVMCRELNSLTLDYGYTALQVAEVSRAKNQLRSSLLMNLESRMVELEDLGRQVQVHGKKVGAKEMCAKINALTVEDVRRVAKTVFRGGVMNVGRGSGAPTVVLQEGKQDGLLKKEFAWEDIQQRIAKAKLGRR